MAKKEQDSINKLKDMAKEADLEDNPLFCSALEQYIVQQRVIALIREELDKSDLAVSKEYVKGRENIYAHPLVKELPKHSDSATKTAQFLWSMIRDSMHRNPQSDGFDEFIAESDAM